MKSVLIPCLSLVFFIAPCVHAEPDVPDSPDARGPAERVLLRLVFKPNTRTLLTHEVRTDTKMSGNKVGMHMLDEVEGIIRPGGNPGELLHEDRRLARKVGSIPATGVDFDSRKWEAGLGSYSADMVEDWRHVRAMTTFLLRGPDGRGIRSWAEGPGEAGNQPFPEGQADRLENHLESKVFWPEFLPAAPVVPGAIWPLKFSTYGQGAGASSIDVAGQYTLKSVERVEGKRLATVEFSATLSPSKEAPPPGPETAAPKGRPPMPVMVIEKGTVEGSFTLDLDRQCPTWRQVRSKVTSTMAKSFRQELDHQVTQTFLSIEPLPPEP